MLDTPTTVTVVPARGMQWYAWRVGTVFASRNPTDYGNVLIFVVKMGSAFILWEDIQYTYHART